jgi:hemerythrin-like domain-containing protein
MCQVFFAQTPRGRHWAKHPVSKRFSLRPWADARIGGVIARITTALSDACRLLPDLRAALARCLDAGSELSAAERKVLARFSSHLRHHLAAENAILLPIARARLSRRDLQKLSSRMQSRRGLNLTPKVRDAE